MTHIAMIDEKTNQVVNVVVPPEGSGVFFVGKGFIGVETETGAIGNIYNPATGEFSPDPAIAEAEAKRQAELTEAEKAKEASDAKRKKIQAAVDALKAKESLTIEEEGTLAMLENSL